MDRLIENVTEVVSNMAAGNPPQDAIPNLILEPLPDAQAPAPSDEGIPVLPNLFQAIGNLNFDDEESTGKFFGNFFRQINKTVIAPPEPAEGEPPIAPLADRIYEMLGVNAEFRTRISREIEIKAYFMEQLQNLGMEDAIVLTKERFDRPDDYSLKIEMNVSFALTDVRKAEEPNVD